MWIRKGLTALTAAMAVSAIGFVPTHGSAGASSPKRVKPVTCAAISGLDDPGDILTVSGCTGATGGTGTVAGPFFTPSIITWAAGGQSTVTFHPMPRQTGQCPDGSSAFQLRGGRVKSPTIRGASGAFHATFCFDAVGNMSLKPGTLMKF